MAKINISPLGVVKGNTINVNKEAILKGEYKRPKNFLEVEKNMGSKIAIWGDENSNELLAKIAGQLNEEDKTKAGLLIYTTMNLKKQAECIGCFKLLKAHDEKLYNKFADLKLLDQMGLKRTNWWKFW
tara:strand:- start:100 stop:483 length:384 start_codon:yes stop_codon:yes gene_type:complete